MRRSLIYSLAIVTVLIAAIPQQCVAESQSPVVAPAHVDSMRPANATALRLAAMPDSIRIGRVLPDMDTTNPVPGTSMPFEMALAALASAAKKPKKGGGKSSDAGGKGGGPSAGDPPSPPSPGDDPPADPPQPTAPLSPDDKAKSDAERARIESARPAKPDPEHSHNIARTGKHDETVDGGRYKGADGKFRNAAGELLEE